MKNKYKLEKLRIDTIATSRAAIVARDAADAARRAAAFVQVAEATAYESIRAIEAMGGGELCRDGDASKSAAAVYIAADAEANALADDARKAAGSADSLHAFNAAIAAREDSGSDYAYAAISPAYAAIYSAANAANDAAIAAAEVADDAEYVYLSADAAYTRAAAKAADKAK